MVEWQGQPADVHCELFRKTELREKKGDAMIEMENKRTVLLEGTRSVPEKDMQSISSFAEMLALKYPEVTFRSGNAAGSDELFAKGIEAVDPLRMEQMLPYPGANKKRLHKDSRVLPLTELTRKELEDLATLCLEATPGYNKLIDAYMKTMKTNRFTVKATYLLRDALKVTGLKRLNFAPAELGIFYVNPENPAKGGTGHTVRMCELRNIPVIKQNQWLQNTK